MTHAATAAGFLKSMFDTAALQTVSQWPGTQLQPAEAADESDNVYSIQSYGQSSAVSAAAAERRARSVVLASSEQIGFTAAQIATAMRPRLAALAARPLGGRRLAAASPVLPGEQQHTPAAARSVLSIGGTKLGQGKPEVPVLVTSSSTKLHPCRVSDPYCFTDEECYCRLSNGTFGAACPMYSTCLGACCSATGVCPDRMGYEDPTTKQQMVLLPSTCSDWGLNEGGILTSSVTGIKSSQGHGLTVGKLSDSSHSSVECKMPKGRECVPGKGGGACIGYTAHACEGGECTEQVPGGVAGAMCVYNKGDATQFDVCSCLPVY
jgi:hypothetical protein